MNNQGYEAPEVIEYGHVKDVVQQLLPLEGFGELPIFGSLFIIFI